MGDKEMVKEEKIQAVRTYLANLFPNALVNDERDLKHLQHVFYVDDASGMRLNKVEFKLSFFFTNRNEDDYATVLDDWGLPGTLKKNRGETVVVGEAPPIEPRCPPKD